MISENLDHLSDGFEKLFSTPSLMKGEDPDVYAELYEQVEEVLKPQDVWDQMMVADITNHFWEQQRIRRCTGGVVNGKRREALTLILRSVVGHARVDAEWLADIYFGFNRAQESRLKSSPYNVASKVTPEKPRNTREDVIALLKDHGLDEADIERLATQISVDTLAELENLALKHEIRREAIFRGAESRREKRSESPPAKSSGWSVGATR